MHAAANVCFSVQHSLKANKAISVYRVYYVYNCGLGTGLVVELRIVKLFQSSFVDFLRY